MTDFDVVLALYELFGGHMYFPKRHGSQVKNTALWSTGPSKHAYDIMQMLLPHMGARRSDKINEICSTYEANGLVKLNKRINRDVQIHNLRGTGMAMREIADHVGCSHGTVKNVISGRS